MLTFLLLNLFLLLLLCQDTYLPILLTYPWCELLIDLGNAGTG